MGGCEGLSVHGAAFHAITEWVDTRDPLEVR
jgi:hypothetical protein